MHNSVLAKSVVVVLILIMTLSTLGYLFKGNDDPNQSPDDWNATGQFSGHEGPEPEVSCFSGDSSSTLIRFKEYLKVQSCTDRSDFEVVAEELQGITGVYKVSYNPQLSSEGDSCNGDSIYVFNADLTVSKSKMSRPKDRSAMIKSVKKALEKDFSETVVALIGVVELPEKVIFKPLDCDTYIPIDSNVTKEYELQVREIPSVISEYSKVGESVPVTIYASFKSTPDSEILSSIVAFEKQRPIMRYPEIKNTVVDAFVKEDLKKIEFSGSLNLSDFVEKDALAQKLSADGIIKVELNDYAEPELVLSGHAVLEESVSGEPDKAGEIDVNKTDELLSKLESVESVSGSVRDNSYTFTVDLNSSKNIPQTIDSIKTVLEKEGFVDVRVQERFASIGGSALYSGDGRQAFDAFKSALDESNVTVFEIGRVVMAQLPEIVSLEEKVSEDSNATELVDYPLEENLVKVKVSPEVAEGDKISVDLDVYVLDDEIVGTNAEQTR